MGIGDWEGNKIISSENFKDNFIYGNFINDFRALQLKNIKLILVALLIFHFEISGKDDNDEHA